MLYILGVDHSFQSYYSNTFHDYIYSIIKDYDIKLLGEEYSTEARDMFHPQEESQLKQISQQTTVKHLYCDPTEEERELLGIESETQVRERLGFGFRARIVGTKEHKLVKKEMQKQWILREKEWLKRLNNANLQELNTLFVLGNLHTKRFARLVESNNVPFTILSIEEFQHELSKR